MGYRFLQAGESLTGCEDHAQLVMAQPQALDVIALNVRVPLLLGPQAMVLIISMTSKHRNTVRLEMPRRFIGRRAAGLNRRLRCSLR
jgi:hypothetical protein